MAANSIYAVLTGDIIESSALQKDSREKILQILNNAFSQVYNTIPRSGENLTEFQIFRGDSFQGVLHTPEFALDAALIIRSFLMYQSYIILNQTMDCRIAIGIGTIDFLPAKSGEGDGEAFRLSGLHLDSFKKGQALGIMTNSREINRELETECSLTDVIISKWTSNQAQIIPLLISGKTQSEIAVELGIAQSSVSYRVQGAGWWGLSAFRKRFAEIVSNRIRTT
ncbi:MAG: SatD family protein [Balneolaceae bacterium]